MLEDLVEGQLVRLLGDLGFELKWGYLAAGFSFLNLLKSLLTIEEELLEGQLELLPIEL